MINALIFEIKQLAKAPWLLFPLFIILIPIFYLLGEHCVYMWDEAIYANNALEMLHDRNWFVIQNNGIPSHYNVKPQLVTWMQVLSISVFGTTEWALRLPSALASVGIVFILVIFSRRWTKSYLPGVFSAIFMVSAFGFVRVHLSRSADLDATLLFFTTAFTFLILDLLLVGIKHNKYLLPISGFVLLAFLSKSLAGFLPLFPLFLLALVTKRGRNLLQKRNTWFYILGCFALVAFYYFIRNLIQPGYFEMVWNSEFLRLTHNVMPWHKQPFHFYVLNFVRLNFYTPHIFVLPVAILLLLFSKNKFVQKMTVYLSCFLLFFLLLISFPVVKLEWYDASFYPVSSLILGLALWSYGKHWSIWTTILLLTILFPYRSVLEFYHEHVYPTEPLEREGNFMRSLYLEKPTIRNYDVYMEVQTSEHLDQMFFYQKNLNWYKGYQIEYQERIDQIAKSDTVLCCQAKAIEKLQDNFKTLVIAQNRDCKLMVIEQ